MTDVADGLAEVTCGFVEEGSLDDFKDCHFNPREGDSFASLTKALAGDVSFHASTSVTPDTLVTNLESRIRILTFERYQARALLQTVLVSRDMALVERDMAYTIRTQRLLRGMPSHPM